VLTSKIGHRPRFLLAQALLKELPKNERILKRFQLGDLLFCEGEAATGCYILKKGGVELVVGHGDAEGILVNAAGPGEMIGLCAAFTGKNYSLTARATSSVEAIQVADVHLMRLLELRPDLRLTILKTLSENVQKVIQASARVRAKHSRRNLRSM